MTSYYAKSPNFNPKSKNNGSKKKPILVIIGLIIVLAGLFFVYTTKINKKTTTNSTTSTPATNNPTSPDKSDSTQSSDKSDETTNSPDKQTETKPTSPPSTNPTTPSTTPTKIDVNFSRLTQDASTKKVAVRAIVIGVTEGKCELLIEGPNSEKITKSGTIINANTTYGCSNIDIAGTEFASDGKWKATMTVTDNNGNKGNTTKEIQITK